ncbi:hypothetical protein Tco_0282890 [Tanacetum coccineum]
MNYVPVTAGTVINKSTGTQEELNAGTSKEISQYCILMQLKDAHTFDSHRRMLNNGEPNLLLMNQYNDGLLMYLTASRPDISTDSDNAGATQDRSQQLRESKTSRHVKKGRETKIPQSSGPPVKVGDEAIHKELGDRIERAATTASSLEVEYDISNIK